MDRLVMISRLTLPGMADLKQGAAIIDNKRHILGITMLLQILGIQDTRLLTHLGPALIGEMIANIFFHKR